MSIEAMKQALEALEVHWNTQYVDGCDLALGKKVKAITALRQAIEQAEKQEPVREPTEDMVLALRGASNLGTEDAQDALRDVLNSIDLYTFPPQRQPLSDEEINNLREKHGVTSDGRGIKEFTKIRDFVRDIEAHGIKGKT